MANSGDVSGQSALPTDDESLRQSVEHTQDHAENDSGQQEGLAPFTDYGEYLRAGLAAEPDLGRDRGADFHREHVAGREDFPPEEERPGPNARGRGSRRPGSLIGVASESSRSLTPQRRKRSPGDEDEAEPVRKSPGGVSNTVEEPVVPEEPPPPAVERRPERPFFRLRGKGPRTRHVHKKNCCHESEVSADPGGERAVIETVDVEEGVDVEPESEQHSPFESFADNVDIDQAFFVPDGQSFFKT